MDPLELAIEIERYTSIAGLSFDDNIEYLLEHLYEEGSE